MYAFLRRRLPPPLADVICILVYAAVIVAIYVCAGDDPDPFLYLRL